MHGRFSRMARHQIVHTPLDYIEHIFTDFQELAGDRAFADDKAIVGGLASFRWSRSDGYRSSKGRTVKIKLHVTLVCQHLRAIVKHYV